MCAVDNHNLALHFSIQIFHTQGKFNSIHLAASLPPAAYSSPRLALGE